MNQDRIQQETRLTRVEEKVDTILTNHLPHIDKKLNWLIGIALAAIISGGVDLASVTSLLQ